MHLAGWQIDLEFRVPPCSKKDLTLQVRNEKIQHHRRDYGGPTAMCTRKKQKQLRLLL